MAGAALLLLAPPSAPLAVASGNYPVGVASRAEPSGVAPPGPNALPGYALTYVTDFNGNKLSPGWDIFTGIPGGDPGGHFGISHVVVAHGVLRLETYRNRSYHNAWITGGLCQCGLAKLYGAYFVRSRVTAPGPNEAQLLWPVTNAWPPEIDFNETGGSIVSSSSSVHFNANNTVVRRHVTVNMTQWHTWGVIWSPQSIIYTVDGRVWGSFDVPADIPKVKMTLNLEQRQECVEHRQCPTGPVTMLVDWVAEYTKR